MIAKIGGLGGIYVGEMFSSYEIDLHFSCHAFTLEVAGISSSADCNLNQ